MFEFGGKFETPERVIPHLFQKPRDRSERDTIGDVEAVTSGRACLHEARLGQRPKLERNRAEGDIGHGPVNVSGAAFLGPEEAQDLLASWRADDTEQCAVHAYSLDITKISVKT